MAVPAIPRVQQIGKPVVGEAGNRPDHRQADEPPKPDVAGRSQPNRDRAVDSRVEAIVGIDRMQPAPDVVDPKAEARERIRLEIDVAKVDRAGPGGANQSMPALHTGHLVLYQTVSFWVIAPAHSRRADHDPDRCPSCARRPRHGRCATVL